MSAHQLWGPTRIIVSHYRDTRKGGHKEISVNEALMECRTLDTDRRQVWYLARHLKQLSGDLAAWGFSEAALLVGAAAISIGDQTVQPGITPGNAPKRVDARPVQQNGVRHG